jgi:hypothetical protein
MALVMLQRDLGSLTFLCLLAGCADAPPPPPAAPAAAAHACEDAYEDLARYFADPERRRPSALNAESFIGACRELPAPAQRCMLFSYVQAHTAQCDEAIKQAPPELMQRIASIVGK